MAGLIDHTLLGPTASRAAVNTLCAEAEEHGFASVCVNPCHVRAARERLRGVAIPVCAVVGFPHGMGTPEAKAFEAERAVEDGARELDMVMNIGALRDGDDAAVLADIRAVCDVRDRAPEPVVVKVILQTDTLDGDEQKARAARLAKDAGADFVKTSTGFGASGATVDDVALLRQTVGDDLGVKASGGIRDYDTALAMIEAGATRIGASRSVSIVDGAPE
ncbi:MAG: deoxyribose-phosphate aldolase [Candidatus Bipolaricaulota bacterium]|nr:MAG: deoxyribose-phosphate aldolase [Candidatus Bipolaricaulota bacterium]